MSKFLGSYVIDDCGCYAKVWIESDGSSWIDFHRCDLHESAPELKAENERLRAALAERQEPEKLFCKHGSIKEYCRECAAT
jgi:hypothetical protein